MINIALNGFGRIGKTFLRALLDDEQVCKQIQVKVINVGKGEPEAAAFALKYDTLMGTYNKSVAYRDGYLYVGDYKIPVISQLDPAKAPWREYDIDWVVEASGHFTKRAGAQLHLDAGAKHVLITAPAKDEDVALIPGVNLEVFNLSKHKIVSLGSCTTNAVVPLLKVIQDAFGIETAFMNTVHAYTNTQHLLDVDATTKDLRKGRAAALNIVPTTTGAMKVVGKVMPELEGKLAGMSLRVPVGKVSIVDVTALVKKAVTVELVNSVFKKASESNLKNILGYSIEPLVSSDYSGNNNSVVVDSLMTQAQGNMCRVFGWYDNEWGYSERLKDFLVYTAQKA